MGKGVVVRTETRKVRFKSLRSSDKENLLSMFHYLKP